MSLNVRHLEGGRQTQKILKIPSAIRRLSRKELQWIADTSTSHSASWRVGLLSSAIGRPKETSVNIVVNARHMEVSDAVRTFVEGKVSKLPRFYDNVQSIEVHLDKEADKLVAEIVVMAKKKNTFVASHRDADLYTCVDMCLHKISEQLRRHKDKVRDRQGPPHSEMMEQSQ